MSDPIKWEVKKLGDPTVSKIMLGQSPPGHTYNKNKEGLPFFQGKSDFGDLSPTPTTWCSEPRRIAEKGDILLCVRAPVGPTNWAREKCCIGRGLTAIRPQIDPKYVYYFLKYLEPKLLRSGKGGIFNAINKDFIYNIEIPVPSDDKIQKKIVNKIESLLSLINPKIKEINQLPTKKLYKELQFQSKLALYKAAFDGKLTVNWRKENKDVETGVELLEKIKIKRKKKYELIKKSKTKQKDGTWKKYEITIHGKHTEIPTWANAKLENLIYVAGRIGWKGLHSGEYTETGPLFLSVHCLNYGDEVDYRDAFHLPLKRYEESPEIQVQKNDILLAKDGYIGKIGIVKKLPDKATVNSSILVIRSREAFLPKFLFYLLSGPTLQNLARERTQRITVPHLYQRDINNFNLPVPPLKEQTEIVKILESKSYVFSELIKKFTSIENMKKDTLSKLNMLPYSILKLGFEGKLVN